MHGNVKINKSINIYVTFMQGIIELNVSTMIQKILNTMHQWNNVLSSEIQAHVWPLHFTIPMHHSKFK